MRIAEQARAGIAVELLQLQRRRVRVVAQREERLAAKEAAPAGNREGHDNAISLFQVLTLAANLDDFAHELVAENVALLHRRDVAIVEVQVRTTDGRSSDADNRIARIEYLGIGHVQ